MSKTWIQALKTYNQGKPCWCIPRKGSAGYDEVRRLMGGAAKAPPDKRLFWDTVKGQPKPAKAPANRGKVKTRFLADSDDDYEGVDLEGEYAALQQVKGIIGEYGGGSAARAARKAEAQATPAVISFDPPIDSIKPVNIIVPRRRPKQ